MADFSRRGSWPARKMGTTAPDGKRRCKVRQEWPPSPASLFVPTRVLHISGSVPSKIEYSLGALLTKNGYCSSYYNVPFVWHNSSLLPVDLNLLTLALTHRDRPSGSSESTTDGGNGGRVSEVPGAPTTVFRGASTAATAAADRFSAVVFSSRSRANRAAASA